MLSRNRDLPKYHVEIFSVYCPPVCWTCSKFLQTSKCDMLILAGTKNQLRRRSVHDKDTHDRKKHQKSRKILQEKTQIPVLCNPFQNVPTESLAEMGTPPNRKARCNLTVDCFADHKHYDSAANLLLVDFVSCYCCIADVL